MIGQIVRSWLALPVTHGFCLDDPGGVELRRQVILTKPFLRRIYTEWYAEIVACIPSGTGEVLELGSGPGFFKELLPSALTSEILCCGGIDLVTDGQRLPFPDASLRAIGMTNVLHHIPHLRRFFAEATRCLRPGGVVAMLEPWVSTWSKLAYSLHHEQFLQDAPEWSSPPGGPLSGANDALPWIGFSRDRCRFQAEFPRLSIRRIKPWMPFRYLLSGGVSMRSLTPAWSYGIWSGLEKMLAPWMDHLGMFALICLERQSDPT